MSREQLLALLPILISSATVRPAEEPKPAPLSRSSAKSTSPARLGSR